MKINYTKDDFEFQNARSSLFFSIKFLSVSINSSMVVENATSRTYCGIQPESLLNYVKLINTNLYCTNEQKLNDLPFKLQAINH